MTKPNQLTETNKLYDYYNSYEHRRERVNYVLEKIKDTANLDDFINIFQLEIEHLKVELQAKKYKNTMWYCHD